VRLDLGGSLVKGHSTKAVPLSRGQGESAGFKKTTAQLAWGAFAWFVSEPEHIVILWEGGRSVARLSSLLRT
jgi:hypothetical protein